MTANPSLLTSVLTLGLFGATANAQSIDRAQEEFRARAVSVHTEVGEEGTAFFLAGDGDIFYVATALHVINETIEMAGRRPLDSLITLHPLVEPAGCGDGLTPFAVWYPEPQQENGSTDVAFFAARSDCAFPSEPLSIAWNGTVPSLGVKMHFLDMVSAFASGRLSPPLFLGNGCIRAKNCFDGSVSETQALFNDNDSGSAVFSADGLIGMAVKNDRILLAPEIISLFSVCASGGCTAVGSPPNASPIVEPLKRQLEPPRPYAEEGQARDLENLQVFLQNVPPSEYTPSEESNCSDFARSESTKRVVLEEGFIVVVSTEVREDLCVGRRGLRVETNTSCTGDTSQISGNVEVWSGPKLMLGCIEAGCFECKSNSRHTDAHGGTGRTSDEWKATSVAIQAGDTSYYFEAGRIIPEKEELLYHAARSLARIVSNGSDEEFCMSNASYCYD